MENPPPLGRILQENDPTARRDALHVAVVPAIAGQTLMPGQHVGKLEDGTFGETEKKIGVVDAFLPVVVKKGQGFWLMLYPQTVTGMRHHWQHPDFADDGA